MIKALLSDLSYVLLFPVDLSYKGSLNGLYRQEIDKPGFKFFDYFRFNQELLDFYQSLRPRLKLYMLTSQQIQKDPAIAPQLEKVFDQVISAEDAGFHKKQAEAYKLVAEKAGLKPSEIIFIDDSQVNLDAATEAGCPTLLFLDNDHIKSDIQELLGE